MTEKQTSDLPDNSWPAPKNRLAQSNLWLQLLAWFFAVATIPTVSVVAILRQRFVSFWPLLLLIVALTLVASALGAYLFSRSIKHLTDTARAIASGNLQVRAAETERDDEIGELARGLNEIAAQRLELIQRLEVRIQERTSQLLTTAEISRQIAALRNVDELLTHIVSIIQERFGLYFAGILLLDESQEYVILRAFAGYAPSLGSLKAEKLRIGGHSIIGWVAAHNEARIVKDVGDDPQFRPTPSLPETQSEMALPLRRVGRLIGVLDIQSDSKGEFDDGDIQSLQGLADLIAIALDNARLFEQSQKYARDMAQAREIAEEASRAKTQFLANMSHELRTPMNAIIGFSQVLERDATLTAKQREYLEIISRNSDQLLTLINDVLDMSKIEAGGSKLNESAFNLHSLLNDLRELFQLRAEAKDLDMHFGVARDVPRYVFADEGKLRQVLINLLSNAIKFTHQGGVSVRVGFEEAEVAPRLHFAVEDTGEGISEAELDKLFRPFVQTASGERSQEGTGLGLAISRQFIHLLGGEISVQSNLERGTVIQFDIRITIAQEKDVQQRLPSRRVLGLVPDETGQIPEHRILVVDDRQANRLLLREWLESVGFLVREAENGRVALTVWEDWRPQLIWMDLRMPVMDGYEATRLIKSSVEGQATAVIALTASTLEQERSLVFATGCDDFVRKPVRESVVFEKLAEHLGVRYLYEEEVSLPVVLAKESETWVDHTAAALTTIPVEWLQGLQNAAEMIDIDSAQAVIRKIASHDPALAHTLEHLVMSFRFDILQQLLHEVDHG